MPRVRTTVLAALLTVASFGLAAPASAGTCATSPALGEVGDAACDAVQTGAGAVNAVCAKVTKQNTCLM